ncbi:MAG: serine hydrolase domain-containing protein [Pseudomonadota bacterium]
MATEDGYAEAVMAQPYSGERWKMGVMVEADPPHRINTVLLGRSPLPVTTPEGSDADIADKIVAYAGRLAERELFSGAVLVARHGAVLAQGAFGLANRDFGLANTLETRFNVASLSKSWTAIAIAQLVEAGELDFDDPVARFVTYPDAKAANAMQIKHLLSHTAGLGTYFNARLQEKARHLVRTVDDYLSLTEGEPPAFVPGERWDYSNTGMVLLGKIIEIVTGRTYFEQVKSAIFAPAGMETAEFLYLDEVNDQVAVGYTRHWTLDGPRWTNNIFENFVGGCPAGGGYGTVQDIHRFAEALKSGRLVSAEMVKLLTTAKPELNSEHYGYGFSIHPERKLHGHSGGMLGCSSNLDMTLDPDGWTIAILANDLGMRPVALTARQLIGVTVPEADEARSYLPRGGMTAR